MAELENSEETARAATQFGPTAPLGNLYGNVVNGSTTATIYGDIGASRYDFGLFGYGTALYYNSDGQLISNVFGFAGGLGFVSNYNITLGRYDTLQAGVLAGAGVEQNNAGASVQGGLLAGVDTIGGQPQLAGTAFIQGSMGAGGIFEGTAAGQVQIGITPSSTPYNPFGLPSGPYVSATPPDAATAALNESLSLSPTLPTGLWLPNAAAPMNWQVGGIGGGGSLLDPNANAGGLSGPFGTGGSFTPGPVGAPIYDANSLQQGLFNQFPVPYLSEFQQYSQLESSLPAYAPGDQLAFDPNMMNAPPQSFTGGSSATNGYIYPTVDQLEFDPGALNAPPQSFVGGSQAVSGYNFPTVSQLAFDPGALQASPQTFTTFTDVYGNSYSTQQAADQGQDLIQDQEEAAAASAQNAASDNPGISDSSYYGNDYGDTDFSGGGYYGPVVLDLAGKGINISQLTSSNTFEDVTGDGYKDRTAWAGAGNAVLFVDPDGTNTITQANQFIFRDWDPTASSDMQALLDVFDTNHDGKLDAGDADFSEFKLMVTNADGTTSVETLAQAGIASIDLTANNVSQTFADGSSIDGETTYTTTGGATGTAATVTFASDPNGYVVETTTTTNATTGAVTVDNKALNADGSLANETISTTSADGLTRTIDYDTNGDGQIDTIQTDDTVIAGGVTTETLTNTTFAGVLLNQTVTTTSANASTGVTTVTIDRDMNGAVAGGVDVVSQREVDTTSGGLTAVSIQDLNPDGTVRDQVVTTPSAGGLTSAVQQDINGDGVFDLTTVTATTVNVSTGARTTTVTDSNADGSERDQAITVASADGLSKTVTQDLDGNGTVDLTTASTIAQGTTSSLVTGVTGATTTIVETAGNAAFLGETVTFVSNDGLTKVTQTDDNGAGTAAAPVFDLTTTDVTTVDGSGTRTETVTATSANGSLLSQSVTIKSADGITRTTEVDTTGTKTSGGAPVFDQVETVAVNGSGQIVDTASSTTMGGGLIGQTVTTTSADGLTKTVQSDLDGNGTVDRITATTITAASGGGSTVTVTDKSGNGTLIDTTTRTTSADGLVVTTQSDVGGDALTTTDTTVVNADNSRTETVAVTSAGGVLESKIVTATSADRTTQTITSDVNGDGHADRIETVTRQANGSVVDTVSNYAANGALVSQSATTTSADGLSKTTTSEVDGKVDLTTADVTVLNTDGGRTDTVTQAGNNGAQISQTVATTSATGLSVTTTSNIDGKIDGKTTDVTVLNADGSRTETVTTFDSTGARIASTTTITSADGLSVTTLTDENGDGTTDVTKTDVIVRNADGSTTETVDTANASGTLRNHTVTGISANGLTISVQADTTGDGAVNQIVSQTTETNGDIVKIVKNTNQDGSAVNRTVTTISANGLSKTVQNDVNGDGVFDQTQTDVTALNSDGSTTETVTDVAGTTTIGSTVTTISANGLSKTVTTTKDGTLQETDTLVVVYNADGSETETETVRSGNGALQRQTVTTISADLNTTTIQTNSYGPTPFSVTETKALQSDGSSVDTVTAYGASGAEAARTVTTTSANGLSTTITSDDNGDGTVDETQSDVTTIGTDGSRTETFTDSGDSLQEITGGYLETATVVTVTSANGLSKTVTTTGTNGQGSLDHSSVQTTVINADGSRTTTDTETVGTAHDVGVATVDRTGLVATMQLSTAGNGTYDRTDVLTTHLDGSTTETLTVLHADGSAGETETVNTSADGRTQTATDNTVTDGVANDASTTVTPSTNGNSTKVVSNATAGGTLLNTTTTTSSSNGLSTTVAMDTNGDGALDETRTDVTVLNADGSRTQTVTDTDGSGARIDQQVTTTSADGLTITTVTAGTSAVIDTATSVTTNNGDGSVTDITTTVSASGTTLNRTVVNTSADGRTVTSTYDLNGDGTTDVAETAQTEASGIKTVTDTYYNADGSVSSQTVTTASANGRDITVARSNASDASKNTLETTLASADGSGSYSWTQQDASGSYLIVANHLVDSNGVDTVSLTANGSTTTLKIATVQESQDLALVQGIYAVVLGRTMSTAEQQTWLGYETSSGLNVTQLASDLMSSSEFTQEFGLTTNTTFVDVAYQNAFGRAPDTAELNSWLGQLNAGTLSRAGLVIDLARIADAPQPGAQFNLVNVANPQTSGVPYYMQGGGRGGGGGGGGIPGELTSFDSTTDTTTVSYYDEATGQVESQTDYNVTGDPTQTQFYNDLGQAIGDIVYGSGGTELQDNQIDPSTGNITSAEIFNSGDTTTLNDVTITQADGSSATITGSGDTDALGSDASVVIKGSGDAVTLTDGGSDAVTITGANETITGSDGTITLTSGTSAEITGSDETVNLPDYTVTQTTNADGSLTFSVGDATVTTVANGASDYVDNGDGTWGLAQWSAGSGAGATTVEIGTTSGVGDQDLVPEITITPADGGTPTSIILPDNSALTANADGTFSDVQTDVANIQSWATRTDDFDSLGQLTEQTIDNDNGSSEVLGYDPENLQPWQSTEVDYNSQGQMVDSITTNDDSSVEEVSYDPTGQQTWSSQTDDYDSIGQLTEQDTDDRDGTSQIALYNYSEQVPWSTDVTNYDAAGQETDTTYDWMGGGSQVQFVDPTAGVTLESDNYSGSDATGTLTSADFNFTDGSSQQDLYDPQSGVSQEFLDYTGANETGTLVEQGYDFTAGNSQLDFFNPASGVSLEADNYSGTNGAGTLTSSDFNYTNGTSESDVYNPSSSVSDQFADYSGANETGTLVEQGSNWTAGGSQIELFNPQSGISTAIENYTGTFGTGTITSGDYNYTNGTSEQDIYNPSSGVADQFSDYSGANETGTLEYQGDNWTAGGSQIEYFNPSSGISTETDNYTGAGGTGTTINTEYNFTSGGSELDVYNPSSGVTDAFYDYSGANETGTLQDQGDNWAAGGSQIEFFNPESGVYTVTQNYTGGYGTGALTSADFNFTNGQSEQDIYNPSGSVLDQFTDYSGANETGTLEYQGDNWVAGGSQIVFFDPQNGVSTVTENYTGGYGSGEVSSADFKLTNGFSLDYSFSYDASGNETDYVVDEYNSSNQLVWYGEYNPSGGYIGGGGDPGYGGGGGYYGGGGYGGGYDFAKKAPLKTQGSSSNISDIANFDAQQSPPRWDGARPFQNGAASHGQANGRGRDIGVIAAYDQAVSADGAARAAGIARSQALASSNGQGDTGARFEGAKQASGVITWSFATNAGTASSPFSGYIGSQYQSAVEQAFQTWAAASGLTFEEVPDSAQSDIRVGLGDFDTTASGVIGYTSYTREQGTMQPGTIIRLEDPSQTALVTGPDGQLTYAGTQAELYQVALHEIGHALGLADDSDPNSVMYYESSTANRTLDSTDVAGIQALYGSGQAADNFGLRPIAISGASGTSGAASASQTDASLNRLVQALATFQVDAGGGGAESHLDHFVPQANPPIATSLHA